MTFLAPLGYLTTDQETLAPRIDRAIDVLVSRADSAFAAVAAVLDWLENGEQGGAIELDFPRRNELRAACAVEAHRRFLRHNNDRIVRRVVESLPDDWHAAEHFQGEHARGSR